LTRSIRNSLGQEVGRPVKGFRQALYPSRKVLCGQWCILEPLDPERHLDDLWNEISRDEQRGKWTYMFAGPFEERADYCLWLSTLASTPGIVPYAIVDSSENHALGTVTFMRIHTDEARIEIGNVFFGPRLRRTRLATEAIFVLGREVFDGLGYRRLEWKCDALNSPSRKAALRFGFAYEGTFFNAVVVKGRNRDTAWYSITRDEWPLVRDGYLKWLSPLNFTDSGEQLTPLGDYLRPLRDGPYPSQLEGLRSRQR